MPSLAGQEWAQPTRGCGAACSAKCADRDTNAQRSNRGGAVDYERWEREGVAEPFHNKSFTDLFVTCLVLSN